MFDAAKMGASETYLGALGVFLGGTPLQVGALATLPPLVGAMAQSIGMRLSESVNSRRTLLVWLMRLQATLLLPIACIPLMGLQGVTAVVALIGIVVVYHLTIGVINPLWGSLVGDVLPPLSRGEFFGVRNKWMAIVTFASVVIAGQTVHAFAKFDLAAVGFAAIFALAAVARLVSARSFAGVDDVGLHVPHESKFSFWDFVRRARRSNFVKFVFFVSSMNFATSVSGPYFAMYMLQDLKFSYSDYTIVIAVAVLAQFVVLRSWGTMSDQFGNRRILKVCGACVAINPWMWLISSNFWFVICVQLYSGIFWSGFTLASANFVFDAVTPPKRARCIAYQAIINGVLVFLGSAIGGALVMKLPLESLGHVGIWSTPSKFCVLFLASGVLRALVMLVLFPAFKEVRQVKSIRGHQVIARLISIRPFWGATFGYIMERYAVRVHHESGEEAEKEAKQFE
jgi:MFS family permease